jgi:hypothetical protein
VEVDGRSLVGGSLDSFAAHSPAEWVGSVRVDRATIPLTATSAENIGSEVGRIGSRAGEDFDCRASVGRRGVISSRDVLVSSLLI